MIFNLIKSYEQKVARAKRESEIKEEIAMFDRMHALGAEITNYGWEYKKKLHDELVALRGDK